MNRNTFITCFCTVLFCVLCGLILSGCVGATRMRTIGHGPGGDRIDTKELDLSFLQPGTTQRDDAVSKLTRVDAGCTTPTFFWGRWAESKWGYWWFVAAPQGGAAGDANRVWHVRNLLLTFDEEGIVKTSQQLGDDELWGALHAHVAELPPLDFSQPRSFNLASGKADRITLSKRGIEFENSGRKPFVLRVPMRDVVRFSHDGANEKRNRPDTSCHVLHFSGKTAQGSAIPFCADPTATMTIFQYLHQAGMPGMRWD